MTLYEYDPEEPYELFFRLNQAYALTPSEKRNALYGRARDQVRSVVEHLESQGLLVPQRIGFSNARLGTTMSWPGPVSPYKLGICASPSTRVVSSPSTAIATSMITS